eukprot:TRINITY_DN9111_c0_g1_i1.p1 TRINITY_DN9111_c0_g1~~TRINITY_DN9111_c0_g1_i1.p1  ORF type:complete len:328 (+),score=55.45 TRINITY_DN9111_c0_g1_i1:276-1259(+)
MLLPRSAGQLADINALAREVRAKKPFLPSFFNAILSQGRNGTEFEKATRLVATKMQGHCLIRTNGSAKFVHCEKQGIVLDIGKTGYRAFAIVAFEQLQEPDLKIYNGDIVEVYSLNDLEVCVAGDRRFALHPAMAHLVPLVTEVVKKKYSLSKIIACICDLHEENEPADTHVAADTVIGLWNEVNAVPTCFQQLRECIDTAQEVTPLLRKEDEVEWTDQGHVQRFLKRYSAHAALPQSSAGSESSQMNLDVGYFEHVAFELVGLRLTSNQSVKNLLKVQLAGYDDYGKIFHVLIDNNVLSAMDEFKGFNSREHHPMCNKMSMWFGLD